MSSISVPFGRRGSFFRDPFFADSWSLIEKQKQKLQAECPTGITCKSPFSMRDYLTSIGENELQAEKDHYKVVLDVHHFRPEEVSVKTKDNEVIVEGKHEEKQDPVHGIISRQFTRKYAIPTPPGGEADAQMDLVQCHLSSDGVLQLTIPRKGYTERAGANDNSPSKIGGEIKNGNEHAHALENDHHQKIWQVLQKDCPYFCTLPDFHMVPFWERSHTRLDDVFGIQSDSHNFKVLVDVKEFAPEELNVRVTDHFISVDGKHEEKKDVYGHVSRQFTRRYDLPKSVNADEVECNLSSNGILEIKAPKHMQNAVEHQVGREVPIGVGIGK